MHYNFDWNYVAAGAPYVTISELAIAFNTPAVALLNNAETVLMGFDDKSMVIGVKKSSNTENVKSYQFHSKMKNGWVRIGCKDFIRQLSALTGIKFNPSVRYIAHYDTEDNILYVPVLEGAKDTIK